MLRVTFTRLRVPFSRASSSYAHHKRNPGSNKDRKPVDASFFKTGKGFDLAHFIASASTSPTTGIVSSIDLPDNDVVTLPKELDVISGPNSSLKETLARLFRETGQQDREVDEILPNLIESDYPSERETKSIDAPAGSWVECGSRNVSGILLEKIEQRRVGRVFHHVHGIRSFNSTTAHIIVPDVVPKSIATAACSNIARESSSEILAASIELSQYCRAFELAIEKEFRQISHITHESLYRSLRHSDPKLAKKVTLADVAIEMSKYSVGFSQHFSSPKRIAVYRHLIQSDTYFFHNAIDKSACTFYVQPWLEQEEFRMVEQWVNISSPELSAFHEKARAISSRQIQGTSTRGQKVVSFDEVDWIFIRCLVRHLLYSTKEQPSAYEVLVSRIVSPMYDILGDLPAYVEQPRTITQDDAIFNLLVALGILNRWDSPLIMKSSALLKCLDLPSVDFISQAETEAVPLPIANAKTDFDNCSVDLHETIRHDFGNLKYFVIDGPDANELDDAISIEPGPSADTRWIHVHVADPTTYMSTQHSYLRRAFELGSSHYLPTGVVPMLPPAFLDTFVPSLERVAPGRDFQVALTFSGLIDPQGDILKYNIRPSILRNRKVTTYAAVNDVLNIKNIAEEPILTLNWAAAVPPMHRQLDSLDDSRTELEALSSILKTVAKRRIASGQGSFVQWPHQSIYVHNAPSPAGLRAEKPFIGDPAVAVMVERPSPAFSSTNMVQEAMLLAGRISSLFAQEHNIPLLYRVNSPAVNDDSIAGWDALLKHRDPETGAVNWTDHIGQEDLLHDLRTEPGSNFMLNLSHGYVKVTSPLRRLEDLLAHFQLKAALLPPIDRSHAIFPFDRKQLMQFAHWIMSRTPTSTNIQRSIKGAWCNYVISQILHAGTDERSVYLLNNLTAYVMPSSVVSRHSSEQRMIIEQLAVTARVKIETGKHLTVGEKTAVSLSTVVSGSYPRLICKLKL